MLSRETGHSRVPAPPHMITGIRRRLPIARLLSLLPAVPSTQPRGSVSAGFYLRRGRLLRRRIRIAIGAQHALEFAISHEVAVIEPGRLVAQAAQRLVLVRRHHKDVRPLDELQQAGEGFLEETRIAD